MLYVKPVPDVDILFTFVTVYLSVFLSFSYCLPVSGEIKLYIYKFYCYSVTIHVFLNSKMLIEVKQTKITDNNNVYLLRSCWNYNVFAHNKVVLIF